MLSYITLGGKYYKCLQRSWQPLYQTPMTVRLCLDGTLDVTHSAGIIYMWQGEIKVDLTPGTGYGSISELRALIAAQELITMIDHLGSTYSVVIFGQIPEKSATPAWDSPTNEIWVTVKMIGTYVSPT